MTIHLRQISDDERRQILNSLTLDPDDLYSLMAEFLPEVSTSLFSPDTKRGLGQQTFDSLRTVLHDRLCVQWNLCEKIDLPILQDKVNLVVAMADVVSALTIGIPPFLIAATLVKLGVREFCDCKSNVPHCKREG